MPPNPMSVLDTVRREVERNALRARNGIRLVAGISPAGRRPDPEGSRVAARTLRAVALPQRQRPDRSSAADRFQSDQPQLHPGPAPGNSFVERLLAAGFDVYLLDWGVPDERDAANRLEDYVDEYLPGGIEQVRRLAGTDDVNLIGYCLGGVLAMLHAAHHPDSPLRGLTVMATPADLQRLGPLSDVVRIGGLDPDMVLDADGNVPAELIWQAFRSLTPTAEITQYVNLWERLWSDEYVAAHQMMTGWARDHMPLPGEVARQLAQMTKNNAIVNDLVVPRRGPGAPGRHQGAVPDRAGQPRSHRPRSVRGAPGRSGRIVRQAGAAPRRRAHRPGGRQDGGEDHHPDDHRLPPTAKRGGGVDAVGSPTNHAERSAAMTILDRFRLDDRVAIITGASSGLGVAFAKGLAEAGADLALGARREDRLADTRRLVEDAGRRAITVRTDVTKPEDCRELVDAAVRAFGRVDILVNNAGVGTAVPASRETPDQFRSVVELNLNACYWMAQACGRVMQPGSSIINISSVLGLTTAGLPQAAYAATKAGLIGLTRDLAQQWTPARASGSTRSPRATSNPR